MDGCQPYSREEAAQMAVVVDAGAGAVGGGREDEDEDDYHETCAPDLALHRPAHQVQSVPVNDDVSYNDSDDAE